MRRFRKACLSLVVWLTAVTTLVAELPHVSCRCPNGQVKQFCLGPVTGQKGCCCDGGCCAAKAANAAAKKPAENSCCARHRETANAVSKAGTRVSDGCCTRTVARPDASTAASRGTSAPEDLTQAALLAPQLTPATTAPSEPGGLRQDHPRPPPTDLVITL